MRTKSLISVIIILILGVSLAIAACTPAPAPAPSPSPAPAPAPAPSPGKEVTRISIAAGSIGGTTNLIANTFSGVMQKFMGVEATVLTYPMQHTAVAAGTGETEIAISNSELSDGPWTGTAVWEGKEPLKNLREVAPLYVGPLQMWVPVDSPVKTFRDLVGKRVSGGTKGMGPESILSKGLPVIGLDWEKDFDVAYMGHAEGGSALVSGKIAAYMANSAPPHPTLAETDLTRPLRLIGFTDEDAKAMAASVSGLGPLEIAPDYYHMTEPVITVTTVGHSVASADYDEEIIYELVKNLFENTDFIGFYYSTFQNFVSHSTPYEKLGIKYWIEVSPSATKIPIHKGAARYYQEIGLTIPPERIPPEMK
ncbi:TAXI family TRAP transporter solute-binding subunit [Chloroflexota bacterium]